MRNEIVVAVGLSRSAGTFDLYEHQLEAAGIPLHIESLPAVMSNGNLGSLAGKVQGLRALLPKLKGYRKIVITDGWDMLFYGQREELIAKVPDHGVLMCAERVCWPEPELARYCPAVGPWRYVNGGAMAGTHEALTEWTERIADYVSEQGEYVDQRLFNRLLREHSPLIQIDSQTRLYYTMTTEQGELQNRDGRPFNRVTGEFPNFIHHCAKISPDKFLGMMGDTRCAQAH